MFDKKAQAEAMILDLESIGNVTDTDIHGVHWDHRKYIVEVRPAGEQPFRAEANAKVPISSHPERGDVVKVAYDPKNHKTEILIEGDPRYDPKLIRANKKQEREARTEALLSGAPVPDLPEPLAARESAPRTRRPVIDLLLPTRSEPGLADA